MKIIKQSKSFAESMKNLGKDLINGEDPRVPIEIIEERRNICNKCPMQKFFAGAKRCSECSCFIRPKTALKDEKCPLGKWDSYE